MLAVLLVQATTGLPAGGLLPDTREEQQQQPPPQAQPQPATTSPRASSAVADLFSLDRIRKGLERRPAFNLDAPRQDLPVYRVRIEGYVFKFPSWQQSFVIPPALGPQPFGGSDYYEWQRLITPPQFWGSAPLSNRDVLGLLVTQLETAAARALIKKAIQARRNGAPARARAEVERELAEIAAHNARVAAGEADGATAIDEAKKKQDEKAKKKAEEAKKKQDEKKEQDAAKKEEGASVGRHSSRSARSGSSREARRAGK